jgi:Tfp pilus assembly protein PilF
MLASTLAASGELTRAAQVGEKAAATGHPDTTVLTNLGSVYLQQGRLDDAKRVLERALTINPDLPDATVFLGLLSSRKGDAVRAESLFRSAINMQPDCPVAPKTETSIPLFAAGSVARLFRTTTFLPACDP